LFNRSTPKNLKPQSSQRARKDREGKAFLRVLCGDSLRPLRLKGFSLVLKAFPLAVKNFTLRLSTPV
jgi:hypothetical protein